MSAIAGIIDFNHKEIPEEDIDTINIVSSSFATDRTDSVREPGLFFSCSHQYFTNEAVKDISPIASDNKDVIFNADIYLYNRDELIDMLVKKNDFKKDFLTMKGDSELAYLMYLNYGISFVNMLDGIFAIVINDARINSLFLITDYVAGRPLAYTLSDNRLYFSTTLHVVSALIKEPELDEEWISVAYADFSPVSERLLGHSVYKNIFRIKPGHYVKITPTDIRSNESEIFTEDIEYWNPLKTVKPLKLSSDEEYKNLFRDTFTKAVKKTLRARNRTGVFLSGGLDSSSVASVAAEELSKSNTELFSYTQVPCPEYKCKNSNLYIEDETTEVLKNQKRHPNIKCSFIPPQDLTCFSEPEKYVRIFAQPVKPVLNASYLYSMDEALKNDKISVVLSGGVGNSTISYGNIVTYIFQKNCRAHFISSIHEASAFCRMYHVKRANLLKYYILQRLSRFKRYKPDGFLIKSLEKKYRIRKVLKNQRPAGNGEIHSAREWKRLVFNPVSFQHIFYYDACRSLFTGANYIDPTASKDIIELCISLPIDCFVKNGKERRAVRDYLKGIVSDGILDNIIARGVQAADYSFRANTYKDQTENILYRNLSVKELDRYLDRKKLNNLIEEVRKKGYNMDEDTIACSAVASGLGCFLNNYKKYIKVDKWIKTQQ